MREVHRYRGSQQLLLGNNTQSVANFRAASTVARSARTCHDIAAFSIDTNVSSLIGSSTSVLKVEPFTIYLRRQTAVDTLRQPGFMYY